ncbi:uncharacterized protein LOC111193479 [Astyanax mexicanus]|uniref:uncharacterized protein LOC111193479 n=1 Tax=Astyanax mexicanus TaxID=7994 RepID=UPI0020CB1CB1|nr:uncharacterized protein LOC111193479 [Astyanax mexicanus]
MYLQRLTQIEDDVLASGCRDEAPTPQVLKNISWEVRKKSRQHSNEIRSLQIMVEQKTNGPDEVLQKVFLHPKGVMLWSIRGIEIFQDRCREDIVYLDATGSIKKKEKGSPPFYVYEVVVRNPQKGSSPLPVATYLTCDHTTASVTYFLEAFQTDVARTYGRKGMRVPIMLICDGSMVLMQAICSSFAKKNLQDTMNHYYTIASGKATKEDFDLPILHRCLSHVMKNAKDMCKKYAPNHYHLSMHVFGLFTTASSLRELDDMVESAAVVFSSPYSGPSVEKHFNNLQCWLQNKGFHLDETAVYHNQKRAEDTQFIKGSNNFGRHFKEVISQAPLDMENGEPNLYFCKGLVSHISKFLLPYAALWTGIMLGDLGRHGTGHVYKEYTKRYRVLKQIKKQNITEDNKTQGIMEKSQWDLKHIRFRGCRLTRLDDFVVKYQAAHTALLKEYEDSKRVLKKKTYRVQLEKWKERQQKKRGRYTSPIRKPFTFKSAIRKDDSPVSKTSIGKAQKKRQMKGEKKPEKSPEEQLIFLWKKKETEVVVSVIQSQIKGNNFIIHHSELLSLQPHQWITGEIIESLLHLYASETGNTAYVMNHYTTGLILFGERTRLARHTLPKVNFDNYQTIVSFVNIENSHWRFLYINTVNQTVYLVDPAKSFTEQVDSNKAAKKFSEYLKIRRTCYGKTEWVDMKWKGGVLTHPVQQDGSSCGVIVIKMARAVMEAFPAVPEIYFDTSKTEMAKERKTMALQILQESGFDSENNCSMCSMAKPPGSGPPMTNWIQCDTCFRWFHELCLNMDTEKLIQARASIWNCCLCVV